MAREVNRPTLVTQDGIIKEQVVVEEKTSREWKKRWVFFKDFERFCLEVAAKRGISEVEYKRMKKMKYGSSASFRSLSLGDEMKEQMGELWECEFNSFGSVPKTSSGFIGWRSNDYTLERYPTFTSPKTTLNPPLPNYCIFLG